MRRRHHQHPVFQPFSDVLMNMLMTFILVVALLIISVSVRSKTNLDSHPKAEFLVTLTWPDKRDVDLDVWLKDPFGHIVYYNNREAANVSLDRDSRGFASNVTTLPNGQRVYSGNREVITVRAIVPGDYIVAVGYYDGHDESDGQEYSNPDPRAKIGFNVQVEKVNPHLTPIFGQDFIFDHIKQSQQIVDFHVAEDGTATIMPLPPGDFIKDSGASP